LKLWWLAGTRAGNKRLCKIISNEEYEKHFRISNMTEIMILEMQEEKILFAPKAGGVLKT